jgi:hypothetical protein
LINGKLPDISHLPTIVQQILRKIAEHPPGKTITADVSADKLTNLYKHWKERTSTSPSGCHLGHWHVLTAPNGNNPKEEEYEDTGILIMEIHANMLNASTARGIPPTGGKRYTALV